MTEHIVKENESFWQIARQYGVTLEALLAANPALCDPNNIAAGSKLFIPPLLPPDLADAASASTPFGDYTAPNAPAAPFADYDAEDRRRVPPAAAGYSSCQAPSIPFSDYTAPAPNAPNAAPFGDYAAPANAPATPNAPYAAPQAPPPQQPRQRPFQNPLRQSRQTPYRPPNGFNAPSPSFNASPSPSFNAPPPPPPQAGRQQPRPLADNMSYDSPQPRFCPYCGSPLPPDHRR